MLLNAVIVSSNKKRIKRMSKSNHYYATGTEEDNKSREIRFYKNEEMARSNYQKEIQKVFSITIDTDKMEFFGEKNERILVKPTFYETDAEYVFVFDESIKDLHYKFILR